MSKPRSIPPVVIERQIEASDPAGSAWVSANAGSGKTHVLAQRVIRLLLAGVDPGRILCITFTKAAASNMSNRVFGILREWTALDDAALDMNMMTMGVRRPNPSQRERARRLFALALETPGGLKVQTIHAFCTSLLHLFPFEANVAARFEVLDEAAESELLERLMIEVMQEAAAEPDGALGRALASAILAAADTTFRDTVRDAIRTRRELGDWIGHAGGLVEAIADLSRLLGIAPDDTAERAAAALFAESPLAAADWTAMAETLARGSKTDGEQAARLRAIATLEGAARTETYLDIFCTKSRDKTRERLVTKAVRDTDPGLATRLDDECARVWAILQRQRAIAARDRSAALFTVAHSVIARFRSEKNRRGLLDYEDLIDKALDLLTNVSAAWVHYKLDRGIHHVLIDEAQDTSPRQWTIVKALTAEFFAGHSAHDRQRTIFAVGDEKQSIFSFQGAAPAEFDEMRRHFKLAHERAELRFVATEFKHSFRSGPNVLGAVDTVFLQPAAYSGLSADPVPPVHEALPEAAPGLVEIWDTEQPDARKPMEAWDAPFDNATATSAPVKLANRIAGSVRAWQDQGRRPGDVLILVRRRGALFEAIIRALKNAGIAVAGADRLVLNEHIAVMDLLALADALLLPDDDLALATVLKSPLFGFDDDDLFAIAWNRGAISLRTALSRKSETKFAEAAARLDALAATAARETPFDFYAMLLGAQNGRRRFVERLGHEANDALDEFLNRALDHERRETPSLQGFLAFMRAAQSDVKRDMEIVRDEVRVMTVHGAKGLEAPIVVLADTTTPPQGWHPSRLLSLDRADAAPGTPPALVWAGARASDIGPMAAARDRDRAEAEKEYRRLLYVAMTRAIDRLVVCGVDGVNKRPEGCWYDLIRKAIEPHAITETSDDGAHEVLRFRKYEASDAASASAAQGAPPPRLEPLPDWLTRPAPAEPPRAIAIKPSDTGSDAIAAPRAGDRDSRSRALRRGRIVHRLLQSLPDIPTERRAEAARRFFARRERAEWSETERETMLRQVFAVLDDPVFAPLFAPGSRAEVPVTGRIAGRPVPGGILDRLAVTHEGVLIADYKTNAGAPLTLDAALQAHPDYAAQLAIYRAILRNLYPDRPVRAALVWTDTPSLMEIPPAALDAAMASVTSP